MRRPDLTLAVPDHNVPTDAGPDDRSPTRNSALQVATLRRNCAEFGIEHIAIDAAAQGIVHVVGPEQGFTLPGTTLVCGDSHTSTHGALGALAFGIGTSEVEHVFATQTLLLRQSTTMEVRVDGALGFGVGAKDVALAIIGTLGSGGGTGHVIEYTGDGHPRPVDRGPDDGLQHGDRGGRARRTGRARREDLRLSPRPAAGAAGRRLGCGGRLLVDAAERRGRGVRPDGDDRRRRRSRRSSPGAPAPRTSSPITGVVPAPDSFADPAKQRRGGEERSTTWALPPGTRLQDVAIENVFIGSCTNSRIEDLRAAAGVARGRHVAATVRQALVVPGSGLVRAQAEAEGLDRIFIDAGFDWREPGCSMCLGMNPDKVPPGERCASTSNRNFVGRQGPGARTHLLSPAMAAAAAVTGRLTDVRELMAREA